MRDRRGKCNVSSKVSSKISSKVHMKMSKNGSFEVSSKLIEILVFSILISLVFLSLTSCHKGEFSVSQIVAQPYVVRENNKDTQIQEHQELQTNESSWNMGLSLYVHVVVPSPSDMQMVVTDPSSNLSWTFVPTSCTFDGIEYYGTSNIALPNGIMLPQGTWSLEILYKDGRTLSLSFEVAYSNLENALALDVSTPFYDATSNLTIL